MKLFVLIAAVAWLGLASGAAQTAYELDTESKLIALERVIRVQALTMKDLGTLDAFLEDSFVFVTSEGQAKTKAELLVDVQEIDSLHYVLYKMTVRVHGDTAILTGLFNRSSVQNGNASVQSGRFMDTWIKKEGRWLMISSLATPTS
jgi:ketosteroid isomerase-like protein